MTFPSPLGIANRIAFDFNEQEYLRATDKIKQLQLMKCEELVKSLQDLSFKKDQQSSSEKDG